MIKRSFYFYLLFFITHSVNAAELSASIGWSGLRQLGLPVSGVIKTVYQGAGSFVAKGAPLLSLDCGQYDARRAHSQAIVDGLSPGVERAAKDKELADELFDRTVLSEVEHRDAELKFIETKSRYDAAVASNSENSWLQSNCVLKADKQLIVLDVHVAPGELLNLKTSDAKLITVADRNSMQATATVSLPLKPSYKTGKKVKVDINGQMKRGEIIAIRYLADNNAELIARFESFDPRLIGSKAAKLIIQ